MTLSAVRSILVLASFHVYDNNAGTRPTKEPGRNFFNDDVSRLSMRVAIVDEERSITAHVSLLLMHPSVRSSVATLDTDGRWTSRLVDQCQYQ